VSPRDLLRTLTPLGWLAAVAAVLALLTLAGQGLGFRWDPFRLAERRLEAAEQRAAEAVNDAAARRLEAEGAAAQVRRLDDDQQQALELARVTAATGAEARSADDADHPLDPDRAARLRAHDRELCRVRPGVCAAAEAADPRDGDGSLPPAAAAGPAHDGGS
jgi:hypothetical protein